jgi:hypothetical protein
VLFFICAPAAVNREVPNALLARSGAVVGITRRTCFQASMSLSPSGEIICLEETLCSTFRSTPACTGVLLVKSAGGQLEYDLGHR